MCLCSYWCSSSSMGAVTEVLVEVQWKSVALLCCCCFSFTIGVVTVVVVVLVSRWMSPQCSCWCSCTGMGAITVLVSQWLKPLGLVAWWVILIIGVSSLSILQLAVLQGQVQKQRMIIVNIVIAFTFICCLTRNYLPRILELGWWAHCLRWLLMMPFVTAKCQVNLMTSLFNSISRFLFALLLDVIILCMTHEYSLEIFWLSTEVQMFFFCSYDKNTNTW